MRAHELIRLLQDLPDQDVEVYFSEEYRPVKNVYLEADYDGYEETGFYAIIE